MDFLTPKLTQSSHNIIHIDFSNIEVPENIKKTRVRVSDIKESFADVIYQQGQGVACGSLAMKIYNSDEHTDYSPQEVELIKQCAKVLTTPAICDGIHAAIDRAMQTPTSK